VLPADLHSQWAACFSRCAWNCAVCCTYSMCSVQWRRKCHTNLKFGMAASYQLDEIWAVDSQENH